MTGQDGEHGCKTKLHESGLTMERWNWPFKTAEERMIVAEYFKQHEAKAKAQLLEDLGQPNW